MSGFFKRILSSLGASPARETAPARPHATEEERRFLQMSAQWLDATTLEHARAFGLGEERTYDADQDEGLLRFLFGDGRELATPFQILGSFQPANRSFRWGWANTSVSAPMSDSACKARGHAEVARFDAFRTPGFETRFEDAQNLAAAAARLAGCDGAYRCISDGALSIFVGFSRPSPPEDWRRAPRATPELESAAIALIDSWDAGMIGFDRTWRDQQRARGGDEAFMSDLQAGQLAVYDRHWSRADDYWKPCSFGWPSDHDPQEHLRRFALPRREGGVYVITQKRTIGTNAHVVEMVDAMPRITDQDIEWGQGLMLAQPDTTRPDTARPYTARPDAARAPDGE